MLCLAQHRTYGLDVIITRCTNNFGPYQFPEKLIHTKLEPPRHVLVSDNYKEYPVLVRKLLKDYYLLEELKKGAKEAYQKYFSARVNGIWMNKIIEGLLARSRG